MTLTMAEDRDSHSDDRDSSETSSQVSTGSVSEQDDRSAASEGAADESEQSEHAVQTDTVTTHEGDTTLESTAADPRPPLTSRVMSDDFLDQIRAVIRQEVLGAYTQSDHPRPLTIDDRDIDTRSDASDMKNITKTPLNTQTGLKAVRKDAFAEEEQSSRPVAEGGNKAADASQHRGGEASGERTPMPNSTIGYFPPPDKHTESPISSREWAGSLEGVEQSYVNPEDHDDNTTTSEWGELFDYDGFATARCGEVFRGLGRYLMEEFAPHGDLVISLEKLGRFYSRFRIENEVYPFEEIFHPPSAQETALMSNIDSIRTYYERISDFFEDLDCEYHLVQPNVPSSPTMEMALLAIPPSPSSPTIPRSSSYTSFPLSPSVMGMGMSSTRLSSSQPSQHRPRARTARPRIPALTPTGFAHFYTICVLAHPDEEARRLEHITRELPLVADVSVSSTMSIVNAFTHNQEGTERPFLPRQFTRDLLPEIHDSKSCKLIARAVDDLLDDLRSLASHCTPVFPPLQPPIRSPSSPSVSLPAVHGSMEVATTPHVIPPAFQMQAPNNRRLSLAMPLDTFGEDGGLSSAPASVGGLYLPPPPVPLLSRRDSNAIHITGARSKGGVTDHLCVGIGGDDLLNSRDVGALATPPNSSPVEKRVSFSGSTDEILIESPRAVSSPELIKYQPSPPDSPDMEHARRPGSSSSHHRHGSRGVEAGRGSGNGRHHSHSHSHSHSNSHHHHLSHRHHSHRHNRRHTPTEVIQSSRPKGDSPPPLLPAPRRSRAYFELGGDGEVDGNEIDRETERDRHSKDRKDQDIETRPPYSNSGGGAADNYNRRTNSLAPLATTANLNNVSPSTLRVLTARNTDNNSLYLPLATTASPSTMTPTRSDPSSAYYQARDDRNSITAPAGLIPYSPASEKSIGRRGVGAPPPPPLTPSSRRSSLALVPSVRSTISGSSGTVLASLDRDRDRDRRASSGVGVATANHPASGDDSRGPTWAEVIRAKEERERQGGDRERERDHPYSRSAVVIHGGNRSSSGTVGSVAGSNHSNSSSGSKGYKNRSRSDGGGGGGEGFGGGAGGYYYG
ncbi:hypothetical protein F5Y16DRAFT_251474 [Xylariaceae sp. FL0255]|nr:hypothetical protein F5Y16DRAFT_251474 [Xylariaceae sp. FL0255]